MRKHIYIIIMMLLGCSLQAKAQESASIVAYEYWFDTNFDARVRVDTTSTAGGQVEISEKYIDVSGMAEGNHYLYIRALNSKNVWSNIDYKTFYIDKAPETRPALKDIRRYRYILNDGTIKYVDVTPSKSITATVSAVAPSPSDMYIDKAETTFTFGVGGNATAVNMSRTFETVFALQYENDQNGWCPPVVQSFTQTQSLDKTAVELALGSPVNIDKPFKGNYVPFTFNITKAGNYGLQTTDGTLCVLLYKQGAPREGADPEWMEFAEVSPSDLANGYVESFDEGRYYGVIYTPKKYDDNKAAKPFLSLMGICATPEIIVNGDQVAIGGLESGALYYYTLDGTEPTTNSKQYTQPFTVTESCVVKAIAVKDGTMKSRMAVALVNLGGDVAAGTKTARVEANFSEGVMTLSCPTKNSIIYYGINQEPTSVYGGPVKLTDNRPVIFYAQAPGYDESRRDTLEISYFRCSIRGYSDRYIRIECKDEDHTMYYTYDGSEPTTSSEWTTSQDYGFGLYCTVKAFATAPYKLNSDTITYTPDAIYMGDTEYTYVNVPGRLSTAYEWLKDYNGDDKDNHAKMIRVKGIINYDDLTYIQSMPALRYIDLSECEVVEKSLPDNLFAGRNIRYFCSPTNLTSCGSGILAGCKRIGGIKWNSRIKVPEDILGGVEYPNLMLYVKSASYANGNIFHNVISNGVSANITLQDVPEYGCFYAIDNFRAQKISYTRNFTMETLLNGQSQGWESLALPFEVKTVTHETNGQCEPFKETSGDKDKNFWLNIIGANEFIKSEDYPIPYHQYIISMPNNVEYSDEYILSGNVTFSATNTTVYGTNTLHCWNLDNNHWSYANQGRIERLDYTELDSVRIYSNYEYLDPSPERSTINLYEAYEGHNPGSVFVPGVYGCKPFEVYIEYVQQSNNAPRRGPVIGIGDGTTGIKSIPMKYADNDVCSRDGKLYVYSKVEKDMPLYNVMGQLVKNVHLLVGENVIEGLPVGTYIVKGKKFMINYKR